LRGFISFIDNERKVYTTVFLLLVIAVFIPFPTLIKLAIFLLAMTMVYLNIFRSSILASITIFRIICWLLCAPFLISIVVIGYISFIWSDILQDKYFIYAFLFLFVFSWMLAGYIFDLNKVKAAILILNTIFTSIVTIAFLTTLDANLSKLVFDESMISAALKEGFSANTLIELLVKVLTFPYIISAIWAQLMSPPEYN
jgi:hypothetical protein